MFKQFNPNPRRRKVGDCTVRALSKALNQDWETTFIELCFEGLLLCDIPSANTVWGAYLKRKGFVRHIIPDECESCYTVSDFCRDHPKGLFILAIDGHVLTAIDGDYYDSWDSGEENPVYYWTRKDD